MEQATWSIGPKEGCEEVTCMIEAVDEDYSQLYGPHRRPDEKLSVDSDV